VIAWALTLAESPPSLDLSPLTDGSPFLIGMMLRFGRWSPSSRWAAIAISSGRYSGCCAGREDRTGDRCHGQ